MGVENSAVQDYFIDSRRHTVSASVKKRWLLMQALLRLLMQRRVAVKVRWRLAGTLVLTAGIVTAVLARAEGG